MARLLLSIIFALLSFSPGALAAYTATGQFCQLSPDPEKPEILASCAVETADSNMEIILVGQRPNKVEEIRFLPDGDNQAGQTLKLNVSPLIDPETVAIMFVDFNFDGHKDFAIMTNIQTGENVRYLYFLFNPRSRQFAASPAMAPIVNPEVIPAENHIRSYWRETPERSGWNLWKWQNSQPYVATRIEQSTNRKAGCRETVTRYKNATAIKLEPTPCR